jgi:hypothetical protein
MIPRRRLSLADPNLFSRLTSPTASAAAFSWQQNHIVSWFEKKNKASLVLTTVYRHWNRKVKWWACRKERINTEMTKEQEPKSPLHVNNITFTSPSKCHQAETI